jgi:phage terminase Nu1 subunit (DNA packaging protein)
MQSAPGRSNTTRLGLRPCALILGISHVALKKAADAGRAPREPDGTFDLTAVQASEWWQGRSGGVATGGRKLGDLSKIELEKRLLIERQRKLKTANDRERKLSVNAADAALAWAESGKKISDAVRGLPARIVNRLPSEWRHEVMIVAEEETRQTLTALSDEIRCDPAAA